jgi:hypothetical protein
MILALGFLELLGLGQTVWVWRIGRGPGGVVAFTFQIQFSPNYAGANWEQIAENRIQHT